MNISELVDIGFVRESIIDGLISERYHETYDLTILNYTPKAQYDGHNEATLLCRGLVVADDGEIIARPFPKFFNYTEPQAPHIDLGDDVVVTDKADGSLLIVFKYMDDIVVATRGSFYSEQAEAARKVINADTYDPDLLDDNTTYLMETVGPSNRVVLQYETDHFLRIADVNNITGEYLLAPSGEPFPDIEPVRTMGIMTLADALAMPPRPNAEGLVLYASDNRVVKVKQEDYIELHRLVFSLNKRRVWEHIIDNKNLDEIKEPLPDEFYGLVEKWHEEIHSEWTRIVTEVWEYFWGLDYVNAERKDFAMEVKDKVPAKYHGYMFKIFDNNVIAHDVLKTLRPRVEK